MCKTIRINIKNDDIYEVIKQQAAEAGFKRIGTYIQYLLLTKKMLKGGMDVN